MTDASESTRERVSPASQPLDFETDFDEPQLEFDEMGIELAAEEGEACCYG